VSRDDVQRKLPAGTPELYQNGSDTANMKSTPVVVLLCTMLFSPLPNRETPFH
jgi:hypothetical protein